MQQSNLNAQSVSKFSFIYYQPVFKGDNFFSPNSKREYIDYGDNLYIGAYGAPKEPNQQYSVNRKKANAKYAELEDKNLSNYDFENGVFYKADLAGTKLENTNFDHCNLWGCWFEGAETRSTNFRHANLCSADFTGAKFGRNTNMSGANLMGAYLDDTDLKYVNLNNALYNESTRFPKNMPKSKLDKMILLTDGMDYGIPPVPKNGEKDLYENKRNRFEFAKIRYLDIRDVNFENNSFKRADLKNWRVEDSIFKNTNLTRVYAREMEATNCDFSNAKMKQINFDKAIFDDVNMQNADLRGAVFTFKSAEDLNLEGARYDQFTVFNKDFDPVKYGMKFEELNPAIYGAKTFEQKNALYQAFNEYDGKSFNSDPEEDDYDEY